MNCRQAEHHIFAERDGALDAAGQATLAAHVAGCSGCRLKRANLTAAANASKIQVYDMPVDPAKPFMKAIGAVGTDTFANCIIAIPYNGQSFPVSTAYATEFVQI